MRHSPLPRRKARAGHMGIREPLHNGFLWFPARRQARSDFFRVSSNNPAPFASEPFDLHVQDYPAGQFIQLQQFHQTTDRFV
jgi:hypothetical protein